MPSLPEVGFSLTERCVIDPSLSYYAPKFLHYSPSICKNPCYVIDEFIKNTIVSRVIAVFASVFALADAAIHLSTAIGKGTRLLAGKIYNFQELCHYTKGDVTSHLKQSLRFAGIALIASIAGFILPSLLQRMEYQPPMPPDIQIQDKMHVESQSSNYSEAVQIAIGHAVYNRSNSQEPLSKFWESATLKEKDDFVRLCNSSTQGDQARILMKDQVYRAIAPNCLPSNWQSPPADWLSPDNVRSRLSTSAGAGEKSSLDQAYYYHPISTEEDLEEVLKSQEVRVRHERIFKGAFVTTKPPYSCGKYMLVFNRSIERLSELAHGYDEGGEYIALFSKNIPVNARTLCGIILDDRESPERMERHLKAFGHQIGCTIPLQKHSDVAGKLEKIKGLNMGVPKEWPSKEDRDVTTSISGTMLHVYNAKKPKNATGIAPSVHHTTGTSAGASATTTEDPDAAKILAASLLE